MIKANELRIGNILRDQKTGAFLKVCDLSEIRIATTVIDRSKFPLPDGWCSEPIPLTPEILMMAGFKDMPHFTIGRIMNKDIGRGRVISISSVGTPNEMICINEEEPPTVKSIIVARNFDYDGRTYLHQLQNLHHSLTGEELEIDFTPIISKEDGKELSVNISTDQGETWKEVQCASDEDIKMDLPNRMKEPPKF